MIDSIVSGIEYDNNLIDKKELAYEYYDLNGVEIKNKANGFYIEIGYKNGAETSKKIKYNEEH